MHKPEFEERLSTMRHVEKCHFTWNVTGPSHSCCATASVTKLCLSLPVVPSMVEATNSHLSTLMHLEPPSSLPAEGSPTKGNSGRCCLFPPWTASGEDELDCNWEVMISGHHYPLHVSISIPLSSPSWVCPHAEILMTAALVGAFGVTTTTVDNLNFCSKPFGA